jgi:cell wall-associated NlpC family hydrolase
MYLGVPYNAGGMEPSTGFSDIGFVSFVYRSNGIDLPLSLKGALRYARRVPFPKLCPGDVMYFRNTIRPGLSHAGIYLGQGRFIHAEWYDVGVRITSFMNDSKDGNYWPSHYLGANRPWKRALWT